MQNSFTWKTLEWEKTTVPLEGEKIHYDFCYDLHTQNSHTITWLFSLSFRTLFHGVLGSIYMGSP